MSNQNITDYVDCVMSHVEAPTELKIQIENELIRYIMEASEKTSIAEVKNSLCSPEEFAVEISRKLSVSNSENLKLAKAGTNHSKQHRRHHYQRYAGEFMQEHSNINLKLLYIPLLQISSGTQRIVMPLSEDDEDDEED